MKNNNEYTKKLIGIIAKKSDIDISGIDMDEFIKGMAIELEHGSENEDLDITGDDPTQTFKIALAHLRENPKYYTDLNKYVEKNASEGQKTDDKEEEEKQPEESEEETDKKETDMEKENIQESAFAKRMKELSGLSENEDKKYLHNEQFIINEELLNKKEVIKEIDETKFKMEKIEQTPIEKKEEDKELYSLNEGEIKKLKEDDTIELDFI